MVNNEVVLTYKRKRFSSQSYLDRDANKPDLSHKSHGGTNSRRLNPTADFGTNDEKLNIDHSDHAHASKKARKSKRIEESEMGPMKLRSHKVLLMKVAEGCTKKGTSPAADSSVCKSEVPIQMDDSYPNSASRLKLTDVDEIGKSTPVCINSSSEINNSSRSPEDSFTKAPNSDKISNQLGNGVHPKESCRTPLITFCRRVKKKCSESDKSIERNLKPEENQCASAIESHAIEPSTTFAVDKTKMGGNIEKYNGSKSTLGGGSGETKIVGDKCEELPSDSAHESNIQNLLPSQSATNNSTLLLSQTVSEDPGPEESSDEFVAAPATDMVNYVIVNEDSHQENSANNGNIVKGGCGNNLAIVEFEKTILSCDVPEKRDTCELDLSVGPPASTCASNIESSKPSTDVMTKNLLESQNSSDPGCVVTALADDEADARDKELKWLEDLEKVLQDKKKDKGKCKMIEREACAFIEKSGINCGQASSGRVSPLIATNSCLWSSCYQEKIPPAKLADPGWKQQQNEETSNRFHCADFLGPSPSLKFGTTPDPFKDFHNMLPPSSLRVKDNVPTLNRHLPWHALEDTSSLQRLNIENVINRSRVIRERQFPLFGNFQRYSNEWSQEELDFLWIGVRRHGIGNWNAMIRDPRMRFLESRAPEDLAMRWDVEQRMLLNGTTLQPSNFSGLYHPCHTMDDGLLARQFAANHHSIGGVWPHASSEFPMLRTETKLPLEDSYPWSRNLLHSSGVGTIDTISGTSSSINTTILGGLSVGAVYPRSGIKHPKPPSAESKRYNWEPSTSHQKSILTREDESFGPSTTMPHWMEDVFNNKPGDSLLPPVVSATTTHSANIINNDLRLLDTCLPPVPVKDSRRKGILKRKSVGRLGTGKTGSGLRITEVALSLNEPRNSGVRPLVGNTSQKSALDNAAERTNIPNLNEKCLAPVGPSSELVVIDSDATSEETISDHQ